MYTYGKISDARTHSSKPDTNVRINDTFPSPPPRDLLEQKYKRNISKCTYRKMFEHYEQPLWAAFVYSPIKKKKNIIKFTGRRAVYAM